MKEASEFYAHPETRDRLFTYCKPCNKIRTRRWSEGNRLRHTVLKYKSKLRFAYGLCQEGFAQMLIDRSGRCDICCSAMTSPNVDHCHDTGKVRGLLCGDCNRMLGCAKDDPKTLARAVKYLEGE